MTAAYEKLQTCLASVRRRTDFEPLVGIVLGSGLGAFADDVEVAATLRFADIDGFPLATAPGHAGLLVFGYVEGVPVAVLRGRVHYYEGHAMEDVVLPVQLLGLLGAKALVLTNAVGAVNEAYAPGDFMLISDHIASFMSPVLRGPNLEELGPRHGDLSQPYSPALRRIVRETAVELGIPLQEGVYIQLPGPSFETPAEIRMCRILGADAVGMSTACETVAARHMGVSVCGLSCVSNMGSGITGQPLTLEEVQATADRVGPLFRRLLAASVARIGRVIAGEGTPLQD